MMFNAHKCPSVEQLQLLAVGQLPEPPASSVERHVLDCDPCAQATLNLAKDETLVGAMRAIAANAKPVGLEPSAAGVDGDSAALPERVSLLIQKLRDLPTRDVSSADSGTVLSDDAGSELMPDIDWSSSFTPAEAADEIGRLNGFRILKLLGQGGMGGVFLAEDMHLQRRVALKVMRPEFAARPGATERFLREARAVAAVHNEHIVTIYQVGQATVPGQKQGVPFLAQELLQGEPLDVRLKREGQLPISEAVSIAKQMAEGLAAAHERGLIHRDIKPANVFLQRSRHAPRDDSRCETDVVHTQGCVGTNEPQTAISFHHVERDGYFAKLLDFGLARTAAPETQLTASGMIVGTPSYMAPEQASGEPVDARADLFSLGVVLYRMTTGRLPFPGRNVMEIFKSLATVTPASPHALNDAVPRELSDLIERLLSKDRDGRPASAREVERALAKFSSAEVSGKALAAGFSFGTSTPKHPTTPVASVIPLRKTAGLTRKGSPKYLAVALSAGSLILVLAAVLFVQTRGGTLKIEAGRGIDIAVVHEQVTIRDTVSGQTYEVSVGENSLRRGIYEIILRDPTSGLMVSTDRVEIQRGNTTPLQITLQPESVSEPGDLHAGVTPQQPATVSSAATSFITLAALDRETIPESERFDWQPEELVAVIGTHRLRDWHRIERVAFHPSGDFFISSSNGGSPHVWSTQTLQRITGGGDPGFPESVGAFSLGFAPDGKSFYSIAGKYGIDLSDPGHPKFRLLGEFAPHKIGAHANAVISPDGRWLAMAGSPGGILEIWDIASDVPRFVKEILYPARSNSDFLSSSKDGRRMALMADGPADAPKQVILLWDVDWNAPDGPMLTPFGEPIPGWIAALSLDGQKLVKIEYGAPKSQVLDLSVSPPRVEIECESSPHMKFSPDGNWLATSTYNRVILRQKTVSGWEQRGDVPTTDGPTCNFWFSPDGKTLVVAEHFTGVMRVWDLTANPPVERVQTRHYRSIVFSPDGRLLATQGGEANAVWKLDGAMPELFAEIGTRSYDLVPPSFSPDSKLVAFSFHTGVWDLSLPIPQVIYQAKTHDENFKKFAPQGQSVLTADADRLASLSWEITKRGQFRLGSRTEIAKLPNVVHPSDWVHGLRPAGGRFINLQAGGKLQVWSLQDTAKPLFEVQHPNQTDIQEFALSDNGDLLAAFTVNGKSLVWDLSETPPREYVLPSRTQGNTHPFFTADGKLLIVARMGGIDIHDWAAGRLVRTIPFSGPIAGLARHPDGRHIATVNGNGTVYILRLPELFEHLME